jgi:arylformamidase
VTTPRPGPGAGSMQDFAALFASARFVDLGPVLETGIPRWPTHPPLVVHPTVVHERDGYYCQTLFLAEHAGAHVDAPAHIHPDMAEHTIDTVPAQVLCAPASVFDLRPLDLAPGEVVDAATLERIEASHPEPLAAGDVALLNYGWAERHWHTDARWRYYAENAPGLSKDAACWLADKRPRAVGADTVACDTPLRAGEQTGPAYGHETYFLPRHIYIIEALQNLHDLPPRCFFLALPLRIKNGSGSPLRPVGAVFAQECQPS